LLERTLGHSPVTKGHKYAVLIMKKTDPRHADRVPVRDSHKHAINAPCGKKQKRGWSCVGVHIHIGCSMQKIPQMTKCSRACGGEVLRRRTPQTRAHGQVFGAR